MTRNNLRENPISLPNLPKACSVLNDPAELAKPLPSPHPLGRLLRTGVECGFTELLVRACYVQLAALEDKANRLAWFDIFFSQWTMSSQVPSYLLPQLRRDALTRVRLLRNSSSR